MKKLSVVMIVGMIVFAGCAPSPDSKSSKTKRPAAANTPRPASVVASTGSSTLHEMDKTESGGAGQTASITPTPQPPPPVENAPTWYMRIQRCGAKYERGATSAATALSKKQLTEEMTKDFDGRWLEFSSKVSNVNWDNGTARVTIDFPLPSAKTTKLLPLTIHSAGPMYIKMSQTEAAAIQPGEILEFQGKLSFQPGIPTMTLLFPVSQPLFSVNHHYLYGAPIGRFCSVDYSLKLSGKEVQGRWSGRK